MKFIVALAGLAIVTASYGQNANISAGKEAAVRQSAEISAMLGLDGAASEQLMNALVNSDSQTAELRAQCAKIQTEVDAIYKKNMDQALAVMTPAQQERYATAVKEGRIKMGGCGSGAGCATSDAKASGCSSAGKGEAKAGGCCAGGKGHSEAKPADTKAAPEKK